MSDTITPHHAQLSRVVESILATNEKALVIDCHSFPSLPLPYEIDQCKDRPNFCFITIQVALQGAMKPYRSVLPLVRVSIKDSSPSATAGDAWILVSW